MPREVICSPSHIRNIVPPIRVMHRRQPKEPPRLGDDARLALEPDGDAVGLEGGEHHGQIARILIDDLTPGLAFLLQRLERAETPTVSS